MKKKTLTKEVAKELSNLRDEIFAQVKKYNKLSNKYMSEKELECYDPEDFVQQYVESNYNIIVVFEKDGIDMVGIEPKEAEYWIASSFCG